MSATQVMQQPISVTGYMNPSPLKISTYTMECNISKNTNKLDLYILSRLLPIYEIDAPQLQTLDGCFIMISKYTESGSTDMPRGTIPIKWPSKVFNNQITLKYCYNGFKNINLKIFSNGKLHMTGIQVPEWETNHMADVTINYLKTLKYKVFMSKAYLAEATANKLVKTDYALVWQPNTIIKTLPNTTTTTNNAIPVVVNNAKVVAATSNIEWLRRNLDIYDIRKLIDKGMSYIYNSPTWFTSEEVWSMCIEYITYADARLLEFDTLRDVIRNQYEYTVNDRMKYMGIFNKYKMLMKLERNFIQLENKEFHKYICKVVDEFIKVFRSYKIIIQKLYITDCRLRDEVAMRYSDKLHEYLAQPIDDISDDIPTYYEFETKLSKGEYAVKNIAIELINSDYNTRMNNNLPEIHRLLLTKYKLYSHYEPNDKYAGIIVKFRHNPNYLDTTKYIPGRCYCAPLCTKSKVKGCTMLTISIFRPGSVIITAAKTIPQLEYVYKFLNQILKDNYNTVIYKDITGVQRDHFKANEDRKIARKNNKFYVKKTDIRYPPGREPPSTTSTT